MHIPDGFLDAKTWIAASALSAGAVAHSAKKTREVLQEKQLPALGIMAAFIFAGQMVNFPIAGGTSGHLLGAALAAIALGPWSATLILATVLAIQCFFFLDGGVTALGANIFNMAVVGVWTAYGVHRGLDKILTASWGRWAAGFLAAWASVFAASLAASVELAVSGTIALDVALPAMAAVHALIGVGEGLITTLVLGLLAGYRKGYNTQGKVGELYE